jgi:hypothetical protein
MEYNTNTYITIAHTTCEALNLGENHRKNNEGTICILEFPQGEIMPTEIAEHVIDTYTHQEALALVATEEWVRELPF